LIVKDPYALLSLPAVTRVTRAVPVLVYRHPGAILASYRRVGWTPRLDEVARICASADMRERAAGLPTLPVADQVSAAEEMGSFWAVLHELALADAEQCGAVVVSHTELAAGGVAAGRSLAARLELEWSPAMSAELSKESSAGAVPAGQLHNFDRAPATVAEEWRTKLADHETELVERVAGPTLARLEAARFRLV
jgi:hypothetical protein